jgi:SAM-dependent methyltransferase
VKEHEDAYGRCIYDHFEGKKSFEIVERDDGYFNISGGAPAYLATYEDWPAHQRKAMRFVKGKVLDIGCGAGRHSLYLQEKGFDVLGIDLSPLAIKVCNLRGLRKAKVCSITQLSSRMGVFDTILMLGNNFGLFGSFKGAKRLLKRFHAMTSENARIIAESHDPYATTLPVHLAYHRLNRKRGRMSGQLRIRIRYEQYATPWFDYLLVSKDEMKDILRGTGWRVRRFIGPEARWYIAILEKEASRPYKKPRGV